MDIASTKQTACSPKWLTAVAKDFFEINYHCWYHDKIKECYSLAQNSMHQIFERNLSCISVTLSSKNWFYRTSRVGDLGKLLKFVNKPQDVCKEECFERADRCMWSLCIRLQKSVLILGSEYVWNVRYGFEFFNVFNVSHVYTTLLAWNTSKIQYDTISLWAR